MFYDDNGKLYLKTDTGFVDVQLKMENGAVIAIQGNERLDKRPRGARCYTMQEVLAQHHLTEGGCYPIQRTPPAQPNPEGSNASYGVKPKK